jgi:hypothetical protein
MFLNYINLELDRHWRLDAPRAMVTLAGDACGVKKHKETYGKPTPEKILRDRLLTKPLIMMKQAV